MSLYPENDSIPIGLKTDKFILRPLCATDVELDYDAVVSSKDMLRVWWQSEWPEDDFTIEDNLKDLQMHEKEHIERSAFTFTVMNLPETECLGCVYISSLEDMFRYMKVSDEELPVFNDYEVSVSFWIRESRLADNLDKYLLDALIEWFKSEWAFSRFVFNTNSKFEHQVNLMTKAGLKELYKFDMPDKTVKYLIIG